jgi:DNA-binding PadR family transcriptional regulator
LLGPALDAGICSNHLSYSAAAILQAAANGYLYGFDIMDVTGLPSGTVYPALRRRLEDAGLLVSKWEKPSVAHHEQRPARKYYEITHAGQEALAEALKRYRLLGQRLPHAVRKTSPSRRQG